VDLLIMLLGATVLLSALVLIAGYRRRDEQPLEFASAEAGAGDSGRQLGTAVSGNAWMFGGGAGAG